MEKWAANVRIKREEREEESRWGGGKVGGRFRLGTWNGQKA